MTEDQFRSILQEEFAAFRTQLLTELEQRQAQQPAVFDPEQMIDNSDFMRILRISVRTAQKWRTDGLIPYTQIGRKVYYYLTDVGHFIEQHHRKAYSDFRKHVQNKANKSEF